MNKLRVAILTISDSVSNGHREDSSGLLIKNMADALGWKVVRRDVVPDELADIQRVLKSWADKGNVDLILSTGGTGLGPRDVTPEATNKVIERIVPGISEVIRAESVKNTPFGMLSRGVSGVRNRCLIVNLPGSPKAVQECLDSIKEVLPHAIELMRGDITHHVVSGTKVINTKLNNKSSTLTKPTNH